MTLNQSLIVSISAASGWKAVYMSKGDRTLFSVSLISWALVKDWNEHEWVEESGESAIVGMVLSANGYAAIPAAEADFVKDESTQFEDPALFCGYLEPDGKLTDRIDWTPVWDE